MLLDSYLRESELAAELQVSIRTLRRWNVTRTGPPRTVAGKTVLYHRDSVLDWLKTREQTSGKRAR
jgi:hypothetical protein